MINSYITEENDSIVLELEMPGFKKDEVFCEITNNILKVVAENKTKGRIEERFAVSKALNTNKVEAYLELGILKITMQRNKENARKIEIK
jgi:HSP20 family molecular chaperone IbpA